MRHTNCHRRTSNCQMVEKIIWLCKSQHRFSVKSGRFHQDQNKNKIFFAWREKKGHKKKRPRISKAVGSVNKLGVIIISYSGAKKNGWISRIFWAQVSANRNFVLDNQKWRTAFDDRNCHYHCNKLRCNKLQASFIFKLTTLVTSWKICWKLSIVLCNTDRTDTRTRASCGCFSIFHIISIVEHQQIHERRLRRWLGRRWPSRQLHITLSNRTVRRRPCGRSTTQPNAARQVLESQFCADQRGHRIDAHRLQVRAVDRWSSTTIAEAPKRSAHVRKPWSRWRPVDAQVFGR